MLAWQHRRVLRSGVILYFRTPHGPLLIVLSIIERAARFCVREQGLPGMAIGMR